MTPPKKAPKVNKTPGGVSPPPDTYKTRKVSWTVLEGRLNEAHYRGWDPVWFMNNNEGASVGLIFRKTREPLRGIKPSPFSEDETVGGS